MQHFLYSLNDYFYNKFIIPLFHSNISTVSHLFNISSSSDHAYATYNV